MMQLQAVDLAAQARGWLALFAQELLHHPDRLQLLLKRCVERDLAQPLVDLRLIPSLVDQNRCAQSRIPMDMMSQG